METLYLEFLAALDRHFEQMPYLFGWRPSIGDYGLLGPLYAHLARDPYPAAIMQQQAPRVFRWVERMNRPDDDMPEYFEPGHGFLANDDIPDTLIHVLQLLAEDFAPETEAAAGTINLFLERSAPAAGDVAVGRLAEAPGVAEFVVRGEKISALAQPHRFFLLQRLQDTVDEMAEPDQQAVLGILKQCSLESVLGSRLSRRITRRDNLEVWV